MAATPTTAEDDEPREREQFPALPPEIRLMTRSIPFSHLRGYGSQPDVSGALAKVDTHNTSYRQQRRPNSARGSGGGERTKLSSAKADYSHVKSRIDTGRRRANTDVSTHVQPERKRSSAQTNHCSANASPSLSHRHRMGQFKRAATLPYMSTGVAGPTGGSTRNRKVSAPGVSYRWSLKDIKSRVDCSDPHPQVTRQTHSLEELEIGDFGDWKLINPRFSHRTSRQTNSAKSRRLSLPAEQTSVDSDIQSWKRRPARLEKRATIADIPTAPRTITETTTTTTNSDQWPPAAPACVDSGGEKSGRPAEAETTSQEASLALVDTASQKKSHDRAMEVIKPAPPVVAVDAFEIGRSVSRDHKEADRGEVVKSKPRGFGTHGDIRADMNGTGNPGASFRRREMGGRPGGGRETEEDTRDSVSSSESVGVNPEYSSMEVDMDAFSETQTAPGGEDGSSHVERDEIVGFEVSADPTQTTVNLLHLLRHKNRPTEETKVEYQDNELWVIGEEEEEEEEEESDMEEEIDLGQGVASTPGVVMAVPQLFVVDENDTVVEKVKTGRRKQSRGSLSSEGPMTPTATDCTLHLQTLSLHN